LILLFCIVGAYSVRQNLFDVGLMFAAGVAGYVMKRFGYESAVLALAFIIGPLLELSLRQSLLLSQGSFLIFLTRPVSAVGFGLCALLLATALVPAMNRKRRAVAEASSDS
jgi:putative tricarboxylic transport membrane protein